MNNQLTRIFIALCAIAGVSACAQSTPHWDSQFGESMRLAAARQTLNPEAGQKDIPESMDGSASREAIGRYRNSFKEPPQNSNGFVIGVGR